MSAASKPDVSTGQIAKVDVSMLHWHEVRRHGGPVPDRRTGLERSAPTRGRHASFDGLGALPARTGASGCGRPGLVRAAGLSPDAATACSRRRVDRALARWFARRTRQTAPLSIQRAVAPARHRRPVSHASEALRRRPRPRHPRPGPESGHYVAFGEHHPPKTAGTLPGGYAPPWRGTPRSRADIRSHPGSR